LVLVYPDGRLTRLPEGPTARQTVLYAARAFGDDSSGGTNNNSRGRRMADSGSADTDLAHRIRAGDRQAEAELSSRFERGITQILVRQTRNFALAQELCQETLIIVLKRLRSQPLDTPEKLSAFVAQTARNLAFAERRKEKRRRTDAAGEEMNDMPDEQRDQEDDAQRESAAAAVRAVLAEMKSARDRMLIVRYYLREEDKDVICRELNVTPPSFNVVLFRARSRFLELLKKRGLGGRDLLCFVMV
jgi:RNA polymerase sigma-70 factor, ECF subfamily